MHKPILSREEVERLWHNSNNDGTLRSQLMSFSAALESAILEKLRGEPVAWRYRGTRENWRYCEGEPIHVCDRDYEKQPLYSAPATAPAPLTNEQWRDLLSRHADSDWNGDGRLSTIKSICYNYIAFLRGNNHE